MPATSWSISTAPTRQSSRACGPMDMTPVSYSRPALAISRLGFTSALPRWNPPWRRLLASSWPVSYGGDLASTDWRHLGRLAGFTNQKPQRRTPGGYAPWVKILHAHPGLARNADGLLRSAIQLPAPAWLLTQGTSPGTPSAGAGRLQNMVPPLIAAAEATQIYQGWMQRWRIAERFPQPDWSIVDFWIARQLLSQGTPAERVQAILQFASPHFPRRHADPDDYLRRTVARAAFPAPRRTVWTTHATASDPVACERDCSNSTSGR